MSNDKVGYGKPPMASRFKKGQSGNPKGRRPKISEPLKPLKHVLRSCLFEPLEVRVNGKPAKVSAIEAVVMNLRRLAMGGDLRAIKLMMEFAERLAPDQQTLEELMADKEVFAWTQEDEERVSKLLDGVKF